MSSSTQLAVYEYCCFNFLCACGKSSFFEDEDEAFDESAKYLSYVGTACYDVLRRKHNWFHHKLWNVTSGQIVSLDPTPRQSFDKQSLPENHSDWFAEKLGEMVGRTEVWCDVMTLSPPDGIFFTALHQAMKKLHQKNKKIIVRMMFANIVGMPVNCNKLIRKLTEGIPSTTHLRLWVGAWRKAVSWNHAKIIAIDGKYLHTGGHNMWDGHYLKDAPVHDLSIELGGRITHDGHLYANDQWHFIERMQKSICGYVIDKLPDSLELMLKSRVTVSEFPRKEACVFPPVFTKASVPKPAATEGEEQIPMISMGRYGKLTPLGRRPSDDGILAMLGSARKSIRMVLQDIGPVCIPSTKITVPGCVWPRACLAVLAKVLWEKSVDLEIVLSNPHSIPGGLSPLDANYGNGWNCVDVASEIIKTMKSQFRNASDDQLRAKAKKLRVCFLRAKRGREWESGMTLGLHSKHFIIDDMCCYIGSQNLYVCDLAEWGVVIDHTEQVQRLKEEYWTPLWAASFDPSDCDVQAVMDGLDIDREGDNAFFVSGETKQKLKLAPEKSCRRLRVQGVVQTGESEFYKDLDHSHSKNKDTAQRNS